MATRRRHVPFEERCKPRTIYTFREFDEEWNEFGDLEKEFTTSDDLIDHICEWLDRQEALADRLRFCPGNVVPVNTFSVEATYVA